jgi:nucleotide-binding universal stress UspA family protein
VDRFVLGSVTEKVLRKATCPVLTVPPSVLEPAATAPLLFARILCAVDFSEPSMKALSYALSIAQEADAQLLVLHVLEGLHTEELTAYPDFDLSRFIQRMEADALARLHSAIADEARIWCKPVELLETGKVYREILRVARERDVHLIVLGVHGRNPVDLMLLGSTTHHVVRAASCPVLTLRA